MNDIFERDLSGEMVSPSDPGYDELINTIWGTMKTATELNDGYHTPDEVRWLLGEIIGKKVDGSLLCYLHFMWIMVSISRLAKAALFNSVALFSDVEVSRSAKMCWSARK